MCLAPSAPSIPAPPPPPAAIPAPVSASDPETATAMAGARQRRRAAAALANGRASDIVTSGLGIPGASTGLKATLGGA